MRNKKMPSVASIRWWAWLICFFLNVGYLCAQATEQAHDTLWLKRALAAAETDSLRMVLHTRLGGAYEFANSDRSLFHAQAAWQLAERLANGLALVQNAERLGLIYGRDRQDFSECSKWIIRTIELCKKYQKPERIPRNLYFLAGMSAEYGDIPTAKTYLRQAINDAIEVKDFKVESISNTLLGELSDELYEKHLYFDKALRAAERDTSDVATLIQTWSNLATVFLEKKDTLQAQTYFFKVIDYAQSHSSLRVDPFVRFSLADAYKNTGQYDLAEQELRQILREAGQPSSPSGWYGVVALRDLGSVYHLRGNDSLAYQLAMRYATAIDSMSQIKLSEGTQKEIVRLRQQYETQSREQRLEALEQERQSQNSLAWMLSVGLIICLLLLYRLQRSTQQIKLQNQRLGRLVATKNKIMSIISHDIKSPVIALQNVLYLFENKLASTDDVRTVTNQVRATVQNMTQNIDNIFMWSQAQQDELVAYPERVDMNRAIHDQIQLLQELFAQKNISVQYKSDCVRAIYADPMHFKAVLQNVLGNALKFTPPNGQVVIETEPDHSGERIHLDVTDTGDGIDDDAIDMIFNNKIRYTRPGTNSEPGSGLGLSLVRELLLLNQDNIEIKSQKGKGTTVRITLQKFPDEVVS
jgi:two-component system, sensor histidine kinase and response regulator